MQQVFQSQFHDIKLVLTGYDEPNNGRQLHVADLFINGELVNNKYFGSWNRLNLELDHYEMDAPDGRFVYIPAESNGFLIDTRTLEKTELPFKGLSTVTFLKNTFAGHSLILIHRDEIVVTDLRSLETERFMPVYGI